MNVEKQWIADIFNVSVDNISSYAVEKTCELRWSVEELFGRDELWQQLIISANLRKPVFQIGHEYKTYGLKT
ncbi:MAG: hypothetical protein KAR20_24065, partial [Candidatus Heimdallarchaeota archaeon]|nr:hypothetical protein [Candidatus Heimdallarchaeota archaeon]